MVLLLRLIFFSTCLLFHALRSCLNALLTGFNGRANNITSVDLSDRDLVSPACAPPIRLFERFCAAPSSNLIVGLIKSMRPRSMSNVLVTLATAGSIVLASPSPHHHHDTHLHERAIKTVEVPGPTVIAYDLTFNGQLVDQSEVYAGLKDGTLQLKDGTVDPPGCPSQTTSVDPTTSATAGVSNVTPNTTSLPATLSDFVKEAFNANPSQTPAPSTSMSVAAPYRSQTSSKTSTAPSSRTVAAPSPTENSSSTSSGKPERSGS
ncbi:hypothetical protein ABVK25_008413 [Lepraria finkii]|uniref:Uncharacterized protein n=1 Tax=Lepraria finkii TaxID=1340010 RepID=A0ABR4B390_9LECA